MIEIDNDNDDLIQNHLIKPGIYDEMRDDEMRDDEMRDDDMHCTIFL